VFSPSCSWSWGGGGAINPDLANVSAHGISVADSGRFILSVRGVSVAKSGRFVLSFACASLEVGIPSALGQGEDSHGDDNLSISTSVPNNQQN
jgi:hypothetical protein